MVRGWSLIDKYEFWVFDRWGNEVFYTQDPEEAWVGDHHDPGGADHRPPDVRLGVVDFDGPRCEGGIHGWQ